MPKEDCKYWDKCYQKNEQHVHKFNHPKKEATSAAEDSPSPSPSPPKKQMESTESEVQPTKRKSDADEKEEPAGTVAGEDAEIETTELRKEVLGNIAGKNYMEMLQKRIKLSEQSEYDALLRTNEFIRHKFLVEMPADFYAFWQFLKDLKKDVDGEKLLKHMQTQFKLDLVGPFEFLSGRFNDAPILEPGDYLRHWRFFYDPPEFQTIFVLRDTGVHYGYWRDTPKDKECLLVARNDAKKGCEFEFVAGNAFEAFLYFLEKDFPGTPFTAGMVSSTKKALQKFVETNELKFEKVEELKKARNTKVVAKTFHRAGIVVPYESKGQQGYRPLVVSDAELKKILHLFEKAGSGDGKDDDVMTAVMEKLQPVMTAASIALDECDFGTSLELGLDLFASGHTALHMLVQSLFVPAYTLLNRPQFIAISKAHMEKRRKELNLSVL